jgi:hypothetical protein
VAQRACVRVVYARERKHSVHRAATAHLFIFTREMSQTRILSWLKV